MPKSSLKPNYNIVKVWRTKFARFQIANYNAYLLHLNYYILAIGYRPVGFIPMARSGG